MAPIIRTDPDGNRQAVLANFGMVSKARIPAGVKPFDPATFGGAIALTVAMAAAGTLLPVRRALRIDPIRAIRSE